MNDRPKPAATRLHRTPVARISRGHAIVRTASISLLVAMVIFAGLTLQMAAGGDPALGNRVAAGTPAPAAPTTSAAQSSPAPSSQTAVAAAAPPPVRVVQAPPQPAPVQTSVS